MPQCRKHSQTRAETGFTLLEVLIALAILIIGIVAVMQLFPRSLLQARQAAERSVTAELANSQLGQIRQSGAQNLFEGRIPPELMGIRDIYGAYGLYQGYTTTVQRMNGAADVFLQRVTFTVEFPDGRSEKYVTFVTAQ